MHASRVHTKCHNPCTLACVHFRSLSLTPTHSLTHSLTLSPAFTHSLTHSGVLRSTFASLVRESPRTLLARQLLSGAAEPGGWWSGQHTFTASAAAGSIVGWLLGLGDRHMDNLLLDR